MHVWKILLLFSTLVCKNYGTGKHSSSSLYHSLFIFWIDFAKLGNMPVNYLVLSII